LGKRPEGNEKEVQSKKRKHGQEGYIRHVRSKFKERIETGIKFALEKG